MDRVFDVIVLSETHTVHDINNYSILGYSVFWNDGDLNKSDGCMIYIKKPLFQECSVVNSNNVMSPSTDICKLSEWTSKPYQASECVFVGYININLLDNWTTVSNYQTLLYSYGFSSAIDEPT